MKHLGKNVVIFLTLIAAGFFAAWLRFRPYLGSEGRFTDGVRDYDVRAADEVRYAVWEPPEPLPGEVNGPEGEHRPALSPDGRLLVFAVGELGLGTDLWVAELVDGRAVDPRPLAVVNSDADEWAPSFSHGHLYFASDRLGTAGGLDLYRARYDAGLFEPPERLGGGVNSSADDSDPAPVPGSEAVVFASNRGSGRLTNFDLYMARPAPPGLPDGAEGADAADEADEADEAGGATEPRERDEWRVEPLAPLNSGFDERDPAFTVDGRTLFFASDREGGRGGFDLYRSALGVEGWVPPEPLVGVNGPGSERGPHPTRDGFELLLSLERAGPAVGVDGGGDAAGVEAGPDEGAARGPDLFRARSRELFRTPGRPVGWRELLVLAALLLIALLAWLAKQWEQLEVLYKCLLISLAVHLLLMWWFRDVYPEGGEYDLRGDSNRIRVRLVSNPSGPVAANSERGGNLEVARAESAPDSQLERRSELAEVASAADARAAQLERAAAPEGSAPQRAAGQEPEGTAREAAPVAVERPAESFERLAGGAEALAVQAERTGERGERPADEVRRLEGAETPVASAGPTAAALEATREGALPEAPAGSAASERPTARPERVAQDVARPSERFERRSEDAAPLAVQAAEVAAGAPAREGDARRSEPDAARRLAAARPAESADDPLAPTRPADPTAGSATPERDAAAEVRGRAPDPALPTVGLADAEARSIERLAGGAPALQLDPGAAAAQAPARAAQGPQRATAELEDRALAAQASPEAAGPLARSSAPVVDAAAAAPERSAAAEGRAHAPDPSLPTVGLADAASEPLERLSGRAPALRLDPGVATVETPSRAAGGPERAAPEAAGGSLAAAATPATAHPLARAAAPSGADAASAPERSAAAEARGPAPGSSLPTVGLADAATEPRERLSGRAPALELDPGAAAVATPSRAVGGPERAEAEASGERLAAAATPTTADPLARAVAPAGAGDEATPERSAAAEGRGQAPDASLPTVGLADATSEPVERLSGRAPALQLDPGAAPAAAPSRVAAGPERADAEVAGRGLAAEATPSTADPLARAVASAGATVGAAPERSAGTEGRRRAPDASLPTVGLADAASEPLERLSGRAPALELDPGATDVAAPSRVAAGPERAEARSAAGAPAADPSPSTFDPLARTARPAEAAREGIAPERSLAEEGRGPVPESSLPTVGLAEAASEPVERLAADAPGLELVPVGAEMAPPTREAGDPGRAAPAVERPVAELAPSAAARLERPDRRAPERFAPSRDPLAQGEAPTRRERAEVELERPDEPGLGSALAQARVVAPDSGISRDLTSSLLELAPTAQPDRDRRAPQGPERRASRAPGQAQAAPRFTPLAAAAPPVREDEGPMRVQRWEHTPYRSRAGAEKRVALELHGGSEETEAAVLAGLRYLAARQRSNGVWGSAADRHEKYEHVAIGKTGLAMLAFLGAGHTQESGTEFSSNVERAISFLLAVQDEDTGHFGYCTSYSHGIATYAMAECFALTGDERLRRPLQRSVAWIVSQQHESTDPRFDGGWGYYYPDGRVFDRWPRASVTAWQVMALESARLGGIRVEDRVFAAARQFLSRCWDEGRGAFRYSHDPGRLNGPYDVLPGSTPASLFALSLLGEDVTSGRFGRARAFVLDRAPDGYHYTGDDDFVYRARGNLYFWYYATLALFRVGGEPWERWNEAMKASLLPAQEQDGSWRPISIYAREYAGDDDDDRTYTTAMCVLTLEVYYRYFTPLLKVE